MAIIRPVDNISRLLFSSVIWGVFVFFYRNCLTEKLHSNILFERLRMKYLLMVILTIVGLIVLTIVINWLILSSLLHVRFMANYYTFLIIDKHFLVMWLFVTLINPILEEIIFVGIIFNGFVGRYSPIKSKLLVSFLFGLSHANFYQFFGAFLLRYILVDWYLRTSSFALCIIGHILYNTFVMIILTILSVLSIGEVNFNTVILLAVLSVISCVFIYAGQAISKSSKSL